MSVKLNSFVISDRVLNAMKAQMDNTYMKMVEEGFILCKKPRSNTLVDEAHYKVSKGGTSFRDQNCKTGKKVGIFHTQEYPGDVSLDDIYRTYNSGVACLGNLKLGRYQTNCYIRKSDTVDPKILEEINNKAKEFHSRLEDLKKSGTPEEVGELEEKTRRESDHIKFNLFNVVFAINERKLKTK